MRRIVLLVAVLARTTVSGAHPSLNGPLAELTSRIQNAPDDATLYLDRGDLQRAHGAFDSALADYARAAARGADPIVVHFATGDALLTAGWPRAAEVHLDQVLAAQPDHERALLARARARTQLGRGVEAALDYTRVIGLQSAPSPDHYVERARALVAAGAHDEALRGLDEGIARLGQLAILQEEAIAIDFADRRFDRALARIDHLLARVPAQPAWLVQRAQILERAARRPEAHAAFVAALSAIKTQRTGHSSAPAADTLARDVRAALVRLHP